MDLKTIIIAVVSAAVTGLLALGPGIKYIMGKKNKTGKSEVKQIRFMDVVQQNLQYHPARDMCIARIVGGPKCSADAVPYQLSLRTFSNRVWFTFCGGSLITYLYVLTAAHCLYIGEKINYHKLVYNINDIRVVAGADKTRLNKNEFSNMQSRKIRSYWRHPTYKKFVNDIAVLEVVSQFFPSSTVKPIRLKTPDIKLKSSYCLVSGFGKQTYTSESPYLRMVCIPLVDPRICSVSAFLNNPDMLVCAGSYGKDSSQGDSGGPLACNGYQVGIVSFGNANPSLPGAYMKVEYYMEPNFVMISKAVPLKFNIIIIIAFNMVCGLLLTLSE